MSCRAMGQRRCRRAGLLAAMATMWVSGAVGAQTPPRAVAVVDATVAPTSDPEVTTLAARLEAALDREQDLVLVDGERRPALVGAVPDEEEAATGEARAALTRARDALTRFDDKGAAAEAGRGLTQAVELPPTPARTALIADLAFVRAMAELDRDAAAATRDFALVHRLDPSRTLDPVRYLPEVIARFDEAAKAGEPASLDVDAPAGAEVWVDGASAGPAPAVITLATGLHAITVTGPQLVDWGRLVEVPAGGTSLAVDAADATGTTIVHRLRRALAAAADDVARGEAIAALLRAVGGQDAIVVGRDGDGALVTWTYSGKAGVLGEPTPAAGRDAAAIVKPLRPIRVVVTPPDGGGKVVIPPPPPPWYRRRWVQLAIGGGVVASVVGSLVYAATRPLGTSELMPTIGGFGGGDAQP